MADHLVSSAQVTERNWFSELALMMTLPPMRVVSIHSTSQLTKADLPIPRPDDTASRRVSIWILLLLPSMCFLMSRSTSRCHLRGPLNLCSGVFFWPHGKANSTNASGSSANAGDHSSTISRCSSSD
jgi:hypothetical protein